MYQPTDSLYERYYSAYGESEDFITVYAITNEERNKLSKTYIEYTDEEKTEIDLEKCSEIFPNIVIGYVPEGSDDSVEETKTYLWFQNLIKIGDTLSMTSQDVFQFHINPVEHDADDYLQQVADSVYDDVRQYIINGRSIEWIKENMPYWCFVQVDDVVSIGGQRVKITSVSQQWEEIVLNNFTDDYLYTFFLETVNDEVAKYADNLLNRYGKELFDKENIITYDDVEDIDIN